MPAYKYTLKSGKTLWYAAFYYTDWTGEKRHVVKRGFATQREAKEYEAEFLDKKKSKSDILFSSLVDNYLSDMEHRLKPTTMETKRYLIEKKILPYFGKLRVCDIDTIKIRKWQDEWIAYTDEDGKRYRATYLKTIHEQLSAILNYAVKHYGLAVNPCHAAGSMGKGKADEMNIWTQEQFELFVQPIKKTGIRVGFEVLFWTGIRISELLALTPADILDTQEVDITKDCVKVNGQEIIQTPKTPRGVRRISIPKFLYDELKDYISKLYGIKKDDRIFYCTKAAFEADIVRGAQKVGLPRIRVHDLRHSNASLLINMGVDIMEISRRLGHESVKTTWDIYGHLYPNKDKELADLLHRLKENDIDDKKS